VSRKYDLEFFEDLSNLNVKLPHLQTRVTDFIPQILEFVSELVRAELAYPTSDGMLLLRGLYCGVCVWMWVKCRGCFFYGMQGASISIRGSLEIMESSDKLRMS
jgi:hypothetical protein